MEKLSSLKSGQKWASTDKPYKAFIKEGEVINDTTFIIHHSYNARGKQFRNINETYRFRKTKTKPTSENEWLVEE